MKIDPKIIVSATIYSITFLIGIILIAYHEITHQPHQGAIATTVQILIKGESAAIIAGAIAILIEI